MAASQAMLLLRFAELALDREEIGSRRAALYPGAGIWSLLAAVAEVGQCSGSRKRTMSMMGDIINPCCLNSSYSVS